MWTLQLTHGRLGKTMINGQFDVKTMHGTLVCTLYDEHTGDVVWTREHEGGFFHLAYHLIVNFKEMIDALPGNADDAA